MTPGTDQHQRLVSNLPPLGKFSQSPRTRKIARERIGERDDRPTGRARRFQRMSSSRSIRGPRADPRQKSSEALRSRPARELFLFEADQSERKRENPFALGWLAGIRNSRERFSHRRGDALFGRLTARQPASVAPTSSCLDGTDGPTSAERHARRTKLRGGPLPWKLTRHGFIGFDKARLKSHCIAVGATDGGGRAGNARSFSGITRLTSPSARFNVSSVQ